MHEEPLLNQAVQAVHSVFDFQRDKSHFKKGYHRDSPII